MQPRTTIMHLYVFNLFEKSQKVCASVKAEIVNQIFADAVTPNILEHFELFHQLPLYTSAR